MTTHVKFYMSIDSLKTTGKYKLGSQHVIRNIGFCLLTTCFVTVEYMCIVKVGTTSDYLTICLSRCW